MCRRFAGVGVGIGAARLREIAAGAPASEAELADVDFAVVAGELKHEQRVAKFKRDQHRCMKGVVVAGVGLVMLGTLLCLALLMLSLTLHTTL